MKGKIAKIIVILIGLYLIGVSAKSLLDLRKAGGRLDEAREKLTQTKRENQELKMRLDEVNSQEFIEKEARDKLNLQKPGEIVVLVPEGGSETDKKQESKARDLANWEKWWKLFFE